MANTVSLSGPIGSSMTLRFGSTGRYTVTVTDPEYPTGGYSGPLEPAQLQESILETRRFIQNSNRLIQSFNEEIRQVQQDTRYSSEVIERTVRQLQASIAQEEDKKNNFARSITIAQYLLSNSTALRARLDAAQASTTPNTSQPNAGNTAPTTIAANTTPTTTATGTTRPATTTAPTTTATAPTAPNPVTAPPTTTNPSNSLPLGDEIDDIYDPNLTPEQIASLSPADRRARENFFIEEAGGTPDADGLGEVEADGTIVVTADRPNFQDWRVKLRLAPGATYLYRADPPGILAPLAETNGIIFPYTPQISINYAATYEQSTIIHSNYKVYQYSNSSVDNITITCDFTAQDTREANYLLAVIHFFRTATKMFFGQDENPRAGTPPPLCYLNGLGSYQFSEHPMAITGFNYNLPNDVDYIKTVGPTLEGLPLPVPQLSNTRLPESVLPGGRPAPPDFTQLAVSPQQNNMVTWVPTRIQLSITAIPIISRSQMSQVFSLAEYANGDLLNVRNSPDGGFW